MNPVSFLIGFIQIHKAFSVIWLGQYGYYCEFLYNNIKSQVVSNFEDCWINCLINPNCTHYTYRLSDRMCDLKRLNGINRGNETGSSGRICGIANRTKKCWEMSDYSPEPSSCGLYYRCVNGYYNLVGCLDNLLFDPFTRQCNNYSACYHGCRNSADKVGIALETNKYYDCQTKSIKYCAGGESFDLKEKKCSRPVLKHMFEYKKTDKFANALLIKRKVFDQPFCLNWCIRIFYCRIVQYANNICKIYGEARNDSQYFDYNDVYFSRGLSL